MHDFEHLGDLLADDLVHVAGERDDQNNEVVHGAADGKGLGVVVEAVAAGEVNDVDLLMHLVGGWHLRVSEEPAFSFDAPGLIEQSCFS